MKECHIVAELVEGIWIETQAPSNPERSNFLIVCDYGDWSGFRTYQECLDQIPNWTYRAPGFYRIEQR